MKCLDNSRVLAFVEGKLAPASRGEITAHLDTCDECRTLVAEVARSLGRRDSATALGAAPTEPAPTPSGSDTRPSSAEVPASVAPGRVIDDKYRIESVLRAGRMAY